MTTSTAVRPTSQEQAAQFLGRVLGSSWLPPVRHCEIAETDGTWGIHLELDPDATRDPVRTMRQFASDTGADLTDNGHGLLTADLLTMESDLPVRVWHHKPSPQWPTPERCATCPTQLADTRHVRLVFDGATDDEARTAPVICVACRDRMYAAWPATANGGTTR
ncbi:hypothetical protein AB0D90_14610 [Streptomyces althioticus]|uniref:hypothetical protein n=1 Tax=Streptomyces althioticus TaxID=83380 RepID=UPI0033F08923